MLNSDETVYIYTLIEHQSSASKLMPLRILKYQLEIISKHLKEYGEDDLIPIVGPLVFYNGIESPYPYKTDIRDLVLDTKLFDLVSLGKFKLIDLTVIDDDEILEHKKLALLEMVLKHIHAKEFIRVVEPIIKALSAAYLDDLPKELFDGMLSYLTKAKEENELEPLFNRIINEFSEYKEDIMSYAEHYTQKGIQLGKQEGIQLGKQEGIQLGEHNAQQKIAIEMLREGISPDMVAKCTHLVLKEINELQKKISH